MDEQIYNQNFESEKKPFPWKIVLIVVVFLILAVVIVLVLLNLRKKPSVVIPQDVGAISSPNEPLIEGKTKQQALSECAGADAQDNESCYYNIARTSLDPDACSGITEEEAKTRCMNVVVYALVKKTKDPSDCQKLIADDSVKEACVVSLAESLSPEECRSGGFDESICSATEAFENAVSQDDPSVCESLSEQDRESCKDIIKDRTPAVDTSNLDDDNDGLTNAEEAQYGSDPNNPDTDGDGFLDGSEVEAGYSPIGPGTL